MPKLLILTPHASRYAELIRAADLPAAGGLDIEAATKADGLDLDGIDIVLGAPDLVAEALPGAPDVAWVQSTWAGARPLVASLADRPDVVLTGVKGVFGQPMAEFVFGYLLAIHQRVLDRSAAQRQRRWETLPPRQLAGKVLGILGVGDIGGRIAATGRHFGMRVRGLTRSGVAEGVHESFGPGDRLAFAERLDVLVAVLPDTPETKDFVDEELLERLAPGAVFVNVGRGATVDEDALVRALRRGHPAWAVLDVFREEPLPTDHPLWALDNAYLTFHTAALSNPEDIVPVFLENLRRWEDGSPLLHRLDAARGY